MWSTGSYMRVYWSGVAYFFNTDIALRRLSDGEQSLDTVLAAFHRCCCHQQRAWNARQLAQLFDRLSGTTIFSELHEDVIASHTVPDVQASWQWLGVRANIAALKFNDQPVYRDRRHGVMTGESAVTPENK